jgi:hypothetical protein
MTTLEAGHTYTFDELFDVTLTNGAFYNAMSVWQFNDTTYDYIHLVRARILDGRCRSSFVITGSVNSNGTNGNYSDWDGATLTVDADASAAISVRGATHYGVDTDPSPAVSLFHTSVEYSFTFQVSALGFTEGADSFATNAAAATNQRRTRRIDFIFDPP